MSDEMKGKIKEVSEMLVALKDANASFEKKYDGLLNDVRIDLAETISKEIEQAQKKTQDRLDQLESSLDRPQVDASAEGQKEFDAFLRKKETGSVTVKSMRTDSDPDGGYLVRPEFSNKVIGRIYETSPIRRLATVVSGSADSYVYLMDTDEAGARWVGQGASGGETSTPQLGEMTIYTHKMEADPKLTTEQVQDSFINVESWLQAKVTDKFARTEATAFMSGTGIGQPKGLLTYGAGTSTFSTSLIEQVVSGTSATVTIAGLVNTQNALKEPYQANATWLMKRSTFGAILLLNSANNYHFLGLQPSDRGNFVMNILGSSVVLADDMPVAAASSLSIAYGDFRAGYTIYDKQGIEILKDPFSSKGHYTYYTTRRVGGAVTVTEAIKLMKLSA